MEKTRTAAAACDGELHGDFDPDVRLGVFLGECHAGLREAGCEGHRRAVFLRRSHRDAAAGGARFGGDDRVSLRVSRGAEGGLHFRCENDPGGDDGADPRGGCSGHRCAAVGAASDAFFPGRGAGGSGGIRGEGGVADSSDA